MKKQNVSERISRVFCLNRLAASLACLAFLALNTQTASFADGTSAVSTDNSGASTSGASTSGASTSGASTTGSGAISAPAGQPIQAGVQLIELNLQVLRDLGLDIKNIIKAASSLYDEVTIQPVTVQTEPEVVGMGTIINIPIGFTPTGAGPQPSKKRVDIAMGQMRPIIELMKQDVDDFESGRRRLDISDQEKQELQPLFDQYVALVNDINSNLTILDGLTKAPPYNNSSIANAAGTIHKDCKKMDEVRRKLYKSLQKDGKKKKNA